MTTKDHLTSIMRDAWEIYRRRHAQYEQWQFDQGIHDGSFKYCLKVAWMKAKKQWAEQAMLAALTPDQREQLNRLLEERDHAKYLPMHMSMTRRIAEIDAKINALVGFYYKGD